jgi:hypothetical protein
MDYLKIDALKEIGEIIDWWYRIQRENAFKKIEDYDMANQKLTSLIYMFSEEVGNNCTEYLLSYVHRKSGQSMRKRFHRDKGMNLGDSENEAINDTLSELEAEAIAEGIYEKSKLLLNAARGVSEAIRQRISIIKSERPSRNANTE